MASLNTAYNTNALPTPHVNFLYDVTKYSSAEPSGPSTSLGCTKFIGGQVMGGQVMGGRKHRRKTGKHRRMSIKGGRKHKKSHTRKNKLSI